MVDAFGCLALPDGGRRAMPEAADVLLFASAPPRDNLARGGTPLRTLSPYPPDITPEQTRLTEMFFALFP